MGCCQNIFSILVLIICVDMALPQPEKLQWELDDTDHGMEQQFSSPEPLLLKILLASSNFPKRKSIFSVGHVDQLTSGRSDSRLAKKGLGVFTQGRPSSFYRSLFSPVGSFSGFGLTRYGFDRPRPLRWG